MEEITLVDVIEIVIGNMAEFRDTGNMTANGADFFETPYNITAIYNTHRVPYIVYNEEGTIHTKVNQGFISKRAQSKIQRLVWSRQAGIPYNKLENDQVLLEAQSQLLTEIGAIENV